MQPPRHQPLKPSPKAEAESHAPPGPAAEHSGELPLLNSPESATGQSNGQSTANIDSTTTTSESDGAANAKSEHLPRSGNAVGEAATGPPREIDFDASYYWTWRVLSRGFSIDECAAIRQLNREAVLADVRAATDMGLVLDPRLLEEL